ncbi:MAG: sulfotransferase family 2 domain-containing protein [Colwellia sp.]|nr:sulfotransferase family 2 domain-containing protein [Colwellia sp.]
MLKKAFNKFIKKKQIENKNEIFPKLVQIKTLPCSFLFIHIPKTAGTSFRKSAEIQYRTIGDYGKNSTHTSEVVKKSCYEKQDFYELLCIFKQQNQILSGHFLSQKYVGFVDPRHILSFVRDPLEQVVSHYNHSVTHLEYEGNFNDFIRMPSNRNIQSRYLNALPIPLYGFIGLTASYAESLDFINKSYSLEIEFSQTNVGQKKIQTKDTLTTKQRELIEEYNSLDIVLINQVKTLFLQRIDYQKNMINWVHGWGNINPKNILVGCAYYEKFDKAVQLELFINNELIKQFTADQFTGLYPKAKLPRARYIGFHVNLNDFKHVTQVQLKVKETGQSVFEQTI